MDKYKEIILYEIENGWIIKIIYPINTGEPNPIDYKTFHCKDYNEIIKKLKEVI